MYENTWKFTIKKRIQGYHMCGYQEFSRFTEDQTKACRALKGFFLSKASVGPDNACKNNIANGEHFYGCGTDCSASTVAFF